MKTYLVGGAVRDRLLDIPFTERDWVVVGASEQQMLDLGYRRADARFPVFLHPETGEEYALARRETKTGPGYKGFSVDTSPQVTLEQDLARRDLTVNAMAEDETGRVIDPFGGRRDLAAGLLRHVTPAFVEDPVRLLRLARFAAKLGRWGFRVAHETHALMEVMAAGEDLAHLRPERVWQEMRRALAEAQPWRFFEVLQACGALARLIPELRLGDPGARSGHAASGAAKGGGPGGDVAAPAPLPAPLAALRRCVEGGAAPETRFAVLLADAVRDKGIEVEKLCRRLRAERAYREALASTVRARSQLHRLDASDAPALLGFLQAFGGLRPRGGEFGRLLSGLAALLDPEHPAQARTAIGALRRARERALGVSIDEVVRPGLEGAALGEALREARLERIESGLREDRGGPGSGGPGPESPSTPNLD